MFFVFTSQFKTYEELGRDADKYNDLTARYHDSWFHNERYLTDLMGPPAPDRTELHKDFRFANFHVHRTCTLCGMSDRYHNHNICRAGQRVVFQRACRGCNKRENPRNREKRRAIYAAFHRDGPRTGASSAKASAKAAEARAKARAKAGAKARAKARAKAAKARARAARREASRGQSFVVPSDSDDDEDEDQEDEDQEDEDEDQDEDQDDEDQDEDEDDDGYPTEFEDDEKDVIANAASAASAKARASASAEAKAKSRAQQEKQKKKKRRNRRHEYDEDQEGHDDHEEHEEDQEDDGEYCTCHVFRCYDVDLREHAEAIQTPYEDGIIRYQWGHVPDYKELYYWFWVLLGRLVICLLLVPYSLLVLVLALLPTLFVPTYLYSLL